MKWPGRIIIVLVTLMGCGKDPVIEVPSEGELYLNEILDFMEATSVNRSTINWVEFRKAVFQKAPNVKTIPQTYQAIETAIKLLNDKHSYYRSGQNVIYDHDVCTTEMVDTPDITPPSDIGYVRVLGFTGTKDAESIEFAEALKTIIKNQDKIDLKGWIVDLRGNWGGNMLPMLAGIGPLLNDSVAGYFIYPQGDLHPYGYKNGKVYHSGYSQMKLDNPYTLINQKPKVAVLIDGANSAGEAVTAAFYNKPNTRLFGATGTCGRTTALDEKRLSDGALLSVASCWMADRHKYLFKGPILPEKLSKDNDSVLPDAIDWLSK